MTGWCSNTSSLLADYNRTNISELLRFLGLQWTKDCERIVGMPVSQKLGRATALQTLVAVGTRDSCSKTMCP